MIHRGVVELQKALMGCFKLEWGPRQGKLVVISAPLDVEVRFVRSVGRKEAPSSRQTAR